MGDEIRDAVKFISQELMNNPETDKSKLIDTASRKFDLNPMQTDFLINKYIFNKDNC